MPIETLPALPLWTSGETALKRAHDAPVVREVLPSEDHDSAAPVGGVSWVGRSQFHDMNDRMVLDAVSAAVRECQQDGETPVVVFDLDSTLYDNDRRTLRIIREWAATEEAAAFPAVQEELADTELFEVGYSVADVFRAQGLDLTDPQVARAYQSAKAFWLERFFDGDYISEDAVYTGAVEYVRELYAAGATIIYLTGRDGDTLGEATRDVLERDRFPTDSERTRLILKDAEGGPDTEFKRRVSEYISLLGKVIATFDNEPGNVMVFEDVFPRAINVFVHTDFSNKPATPGRAVHTISGFER